MDKKKKYSKLNIFLSIVAVLTISAVGTVLLQMETMEQSTKFVPEINYSDVISENSITAENSIRVNINTASKEELMLLTGIGEKKAEAILAYREKLAFEKLEDIMNVEGIGKKTYEKLAANICIE